jgi:hypothetical protein
MPAATASTAAGDGETTDLSTQYDTPLGLAHTTMQALKDRIKLHYDLASDYYLNLWYASLTHHSCIASSLPFNMTITTSSHHHPLTHPSPLTLPKERDK